MANLTPTPPPKSSILLVLGLSVLVVSTAAILIRLAQNAGVPSVSIAFWRLGIAAIVLMLVVLPQPQFRRELRAISRNIWLAIIFSGFFLALHFVTWISSLEYTSVASSAALVTTNPIWIALISWLIFKERISGWLGMGIATAMFGSVCIFLSDAGIGGGSQPMLGNSLALLGNSLALIGSLTVSGYLLIGQRIAKHISLWLYVWLVYSAGALFLGLIALISGASLAGFTGIGWLCLIALALGPQLMGHTGINASLKYLSPALVAVAILAEPIGSAAFAWLIFDEQFQPLQIVGFALLLAGIFLAVKKSTSAPA